MTKQLVADQSAPAPVASQNQPVERQKGFAVSGRPAPHAAWSPGEPPGSRTGSRADVGRGRGHRFDRIAVIDPPLTTRLPTRVSSEDAFEREADRVAAEVVRPLRPGAVDGGAVPVAEQSPGGAEGPSRAEHGAPGLLELRNPPPVPPMRALSTSGPAPGSGPADELAVEVHDRALSGRGSPLPADLRAQFGDRLGYDFSRVRIHTDRSAATLARALNARAFAVGPHLVFETGEYAPHTSTGQRLLAHELTHVVQQSRGALRVQCTVKSALQTIADHRESIKAIALEVGIDPMLIARVLFQENRNDGNIVRYDDDSWWNVGSVTGIGGPELKNLISMTANRFEGFNGSVGIGEMTIETAREVINLYMPDQVFHFLLVDGTMPPQPVDHPATYSRKGSELTSADINSLLVLDDDFALRITGLYLKHLQEADINQPPPDGGLGVSQETLLKDYNRGLEGHEKGVESSVGTRSGPYTAEIADALETGHVPDEPQQKDDWQRSLIRVHNKAQVPQRVYVSFHSEIAHESAWYNNNFARYWDLNPGESTLLAWEGAPIRSDQVRIRYQALTAGVSPSPETAGQTEEYTPGYTPDPKGEFTIELEDRGAPLSKDEYMESILERNIFDSSAAGQPYHKTPQLKDSFLLLGTWIVSGPEGTEPAARTNAYLKNRETGVATIYYVGDVVQWSAQGAETMVEVVSIERLEMTVRHPDDSLEVLEPGSGSGTASPAPAPGTDEELLDEVELEEDSPFGAGWLRVYDDRIEFDAADDASKNLTFQKREDGGYDVLDVEGNPVPVDMTMWLIEALGYDPRQ